MSDIELDLNQNIYHWINQAVKEYTRNNNNFGVAMNRITILWILTLIIWWFK